MIFLRNPENAKDIARNTRNKVQKMPKIPEEISVNAAQVVCEEMSANGIFQQILLANRGDIRFDGFQLCRIVQPKAVFQNAAVWVAVNRTRNSVNVISSKAVSHFRVPE